METNLRQIHKKLMESENTANAIDNRIVNILNQLDNTQIHHVDRDPAPDQNKSGGLITDMTDTSYQINDILTTIFKNLDGLEKVLFGSELQPKNNIDTIKKEKMY